VDSVLISVRQAGIPVYCIALDQTQTNSNLSKRLGEISQNTGGIAFAVRTTNDVSRAFEEITRDLQCLYLLGYYSGTSNRTPWHRIQVSLPQQRGFKVRAKEGYWQ
jgi:hypothetical protein